MPKEILVIFWCAAQSIDNRTIMKIRRTTFMFAVNSAAKKKKLQLKGHTLPIIFNQIFTIAPCFAYMLFLMRSMCNILCCAAFVYIVIIIISHAHINTVILRSRAAQIENIYFIQFAIEKTTCCAV